MSEYNIQMNKYNALNAQYDQLYPVTKIEDVDGLDTALQNKAPSGYGVGDNVNGFYTSTLDDGTLGLAHLESVRSGMSIASTKRFSFGDPYTLKILETTRSVDCKLYWFSSTNALAEFTTVTGDNVMLRAYRSYNQGTWGPIEFANPKMTLGKEYRTTERYNGKPVYTMAVDCKSGPTAGNATATYIGIGETVAAENVLSVDAFCGGGYTIPPGSHYTSVGLYVTAKPSVGTNPTNQITVYARTAENVSDQHIYAIIKYTKTA